MQCFYYNEEWDLIKTSPEEAYYQAQKYCKYDRILGMLEH